MNSTEVSHSGRAIVRGVLAAMAASVILIFVGLPSIHPTGGWAEASALESTASAQAGHGQERDGESELPWLFAVYIITWAGFFSYVFLMSRRRRELQRDIEALREALADRIGPPTHGKGA